MTRISALLFAVLIVCALGLVGSQHQARKLFVELQAKQERTRALEVEFGQLQLEQSTWATHARIEKVAREELSLVRPESSEIYVIEYQ